MTYHIKNNQVFYKAEGFWNEFELKGVNASEFKSLSGHHCKDHQNVFFQNRIIQGADPKTFQSLDDEYGKDEKNVFWQTLIIDGAHAPSFESLNHGFAKDRNHHYEGTRIRERSPKQEEISKIEKAKADQELLLKKRIQSGDLQALDELINWHGESGESLKAFVWMHVAVELNHNKEEWKETIELVKEEDLNKDEIAEGYQKIEEIFSEGKWVKKSEILSKKYLQIKGQA